MEKIYTISKMVKFEHTWIVEPSAFETHCPCCEVTTGTTKWLLNCCTDGVGDRQCNECYGPYLILLSEQRKDAIISVYEEGAGRKVCLDKARYRMESQTKLPLQILDSNDSIPVDLAAAQHRTKRRKIITEIHFYENITMNYDVSYVL